MYGEAKGETLVAVAKASANGALKSCMADPNAGDLTMARLKRA